MYLSKKYDSFDENFLELWVNQMPLPAKKSDTFLLNCKLSEA